MLLLTSTAEVNQETTQLPVVQGILDPTLELAKLEKKQAEAQSRIDAVHKRMAMPSYAEKTPQAVQAEDADKLAKAEAEAAAAAQHMEDMRKMIEAQ